MTRYWRTAFDEPAVPGKASMARICAFVSLMSAIGFGLAAFVYAFKVLVLKEPHGGAGELGILIGFAGGFLTAGVLGLLLRKKADGTSEPDDAPAPPPTTDASTTINVQTKANTP